ncbi:ARM repeat-containing protein [Phlyctochytrium arcticum]|nr:ARM repeat-containing protein [Phlyctochytrium arcticum]
METFGAELEALLKQVTSGDNARIQAATAELSSKYYSKVLCIPALFELATRHSDLAIRQLAAVELRKQIRKASGDWWDTLELSYRESIKQRILDVILTESSKPVRSALARVISEIAKVELEKDRWNELLTFLYSCCQSSTVHHREIGVFVLDALFEVIADTLTDRIPELFNLFAKTLSDPESLEVRITTLFALGKIADFIDPQAQEDIASFRTLLPGMVSVLLDCLNSGDEQSAVRGFEVFDSLLVIETPLLSRHMPELVQFFVQVGSNKEYESRARVSALSCLMWSIVFKTKKLTSLKLITPIVGSMFPIAAESDPEDPDEDSPGKLALQILNSLSTNLAPKHVFPDCSRLIVEYMNNPNPHARKAAMLAFGVLVDGCADHMRTKMSDLLLLLSQGLRDSESIVRRAACIALGSVAEELGDEIAQHHATLLPLIFNLMNDPDETVHKSSTHALDAILEGLGDDITPYLPALMEKLVFLLDSGSPAVIGVVIACIGSAAHSAGDDFLPYFPQVMMRLQTFMQLTDVEGLELRGLATDTISAVAEAVGKEPFRPHMQQTMTQAMQGLDLDDSRLRECSYVFFSVMARVFEEEFAPYLTAVVPQLLKSCNEEDSFASDAAVGDDEQSLSLDQEDGDEHFSGLNMNNALAEEKDTAARCLGQIFEACRSAFMPYLQESVAVLPKLLEHYHDNVRKSAVDAFLTFITTFYKISTSGRSWKAGDPPVAVDENVATLTKMGIDAILLMLDQEENRSVVAQTFNELVECLKEIGPYALSDRAQAVAEVVLLVLQKEHTCQVDCEVDDDEMEASVMRRTATKVEEDDEQAEYDAILASSACDLVGAMALALGPEFGVYFQQFFPLIAKYYKKNKPVSDRSMATGVLSECAEGLKSAVTPYTTELLSILIRALSDEDEEVRGNAAYGVGIIIANTESDVTSYYAQVLQLLRPLFDVKTHPHMADNAAGAVCRMITRNPASVPLDQVLPVVMQHLPLKKDFQENEPVFRCIVYLLQNNNPYLLSNMPGLLNVFVQVLGPPETQLTESTRASIIGLLQSLKSNHSDSFQTMIAGLGPEVQTALVAHLN